MSLVASPGTPSIPTVGDATVTITEPTMFRPYRVAPDVDVLPAYLPVPGMGVLPAHSFVIHAEEPVVVDTGPGGLGPSYHEALRSVIDPADLRWLWLTHTDPDHTGALAWLLEAAPRLRVVTSSPGCPTPTRGSVPTSGRSRGCWPRSTPDCGRGRRGALVPAGRSRVRTQASTSPRCSSTSTAGSRPWRARPWTGSTGIG